MDNLQVKSESLAGRCEICHQTDCFDPQTNFCSRCAGLSVKPESVYCSSPVYLDAVNDARFVRTFGIIALLNSVLILLTKAIGLGVGLVVIGYGKPKFYRTLGLTVIILSILGILTGIGPLVGSLALSIGICLKSWKILKLLRNEGKGDPDWLMTRKRAITGMITSGIGALIGLGWIALIVISLAIMAVYFNQRTSYVTPTFDPANVNQVDSNGKTALMRAAIDGDTRAVEKLLSLNANVNAHDVAGETALMWAAETGHTDIMKKLRSAGADINVKNVNGKTPLMQALTYKFNETAKTLIAMGADVNLKNNVGMTALTYAYQNGDIDMINALKAAGAKE
jgi:hypothetical protein